MFLDPSIFTKGPERARGRRERGRKIVRAWTIEATGVSYSGTKWCFGGLLKESRDRGVEVARVARKRGFDACTRRDWPGQAP